MDSSHSHNNNTKKPSSKISDIVSLQRILKKWKRIATTTTTAPSTPTAAAATTSKSMKFIRRTFSFNDVASAATSSSSNGAVPKGSVAVCVGKELKRYVVPTEHLGHHAFRVLLRQAEEEFGFQQEGVLRIPCDVASFEAILKVVRGKTTPYSSSDHHVYDNDMMMMMSDGEEDYEEQYCHQFGFPASPATGSGGCCSPSSSSADSDQYHGHQQQHHHHPQMCR
ncbi:unnamed protein product [Linum tenue]|uniref:Uncharacterized protein n=1 Tax=Linum tenue TaxID=586396 RepID=A0AAV0JMS4_9ROSI|nr:unnamed protein product [Linum tenue]